MKKCFSKKFFAVALLFFMMSALFPFPAAAAQFGGQIKDMIPCLFPFGGFYIELGGPVGGKFIYQSGFSISFLFGPPSHHGQWLLGYSGGGASCYTAREHGKWRNKKSGGLIIFHGSSLF